MELLELLEPLELKVQIELVVLRLVVEVRFPLVWIGLQRLVQLAQLAQLGLPQAFCWPWLWAPERLPHLRWEPRNQRAFNQCFDIHRKIQQEKHHMDTTQ